jgi:hypothetical protein
MRAVFSNDASRLKAQSTAHGADVDRTEAFSVDGTETRTPPGITCRDGVFKELEQLQPSS